MNWQSINTLPELKAGMYKFLVKYPDGFIATSIYNTFTKKWFNRDRLLQKPEFFDPDVLAQLTV
jgi:hypothetical protein